MQAIIDIDAQLLLYAKQQATQQNCTLTSILEDALRDYFAHLRLPREPIKLETFSGTGLRPGVNLDDSRQLNDIMDGY